RERCIGAPGISGLSATDDGVLFTQELCRGGVDVFSGQRHFLKTPDRLILAVRGCRFSELLGMLHSFVNAGTDNPAGRCVPTGADLDRIAHAVYPTGSDKGSSGTS